MTLPNFLVVGAAKAGTTSLYHYLKQHPDIYMSPDKEPRFFAFEGDSTGVYPYTELSDYEKLFRGVKNERAIGEASTFYLCSDVAPGRIKAQVPGMKMVAVLRNPVDRAFSHFVYLKREGREKEQDFKTIIDRELGVNMASNCNGYISRGLYGSQLKNYFEIFSREQIRIYLYEDLCERPRETMRDLYSFLGVNPDFIPDTSRHHNITTVAGPGLKQLLYSRLMRADRIRKLLFKILPDKLYWNVVIPVVRMIAASLRGKTSKTDVESLDGDLRKDLINIYRDDVNLAEELIGRDLSRWLR